MKITLSTNTANAIQQMMSTALDKKIPNAALHRLELVVENGRFTVNACNNVSLRSFTTTDFTCEEAGKILVPLWRKLKPKEFALEIEQSENVLYFHYRSNIVTITESYERLDLGYPNVSDFFNRAEPENSMYFNPKLLGEALLALEDWKEVKLSFCGSSGVLINTPNTYKGLVLPVRPKREF